MLVKEVVGLMLLLPPRERQLATDDIQVAIMGKVPVVLVFMAMDKMVQKVL